MLQSIIKVTPHKACAVLPKERTKESPDIISRKINTRLLMEDNKMKKENAALPYVQAEGRISDSGACKSAPFGVCADNFCSAGHC